MDVFGTKMPDITPAQLMQAAQWVGSQAISMGTISQPREQILLSVCSTALAIGHILADAFLRGKRAIAEAHKEWAATQLTATPIAGPPPGP